jgi:hypothetical protein
MKHANLGHQLCVLGGVSSVHGVNAAHTPAFVTSHRMSGASCTADHNTEAHSKAFIRS